MVRSIPWTRCVAVVGLLVCGWLASPRAAQALVPARLPISGALLNAGGSPAPDGAYIVFVALYSSPDAKDAFFAETHVGVKVSGAQFGLVAGGVDPKKNPLPQSQFQGGQVWLGLAFNTDPELPRVPLDSVAYAIAAGRADVATGLECQGCLDGSQLAAASVVADQVAFAYAASTQKGGAATGLECSGCLDGTQLAFGAVDPDKVSFKYAGAADKGGAALDLACTGCVSASEVAFNYAASSAPAGPASDVACVGCISATELDFAAATAADVQKLQAWTASGADIFYDKGKVGIGTNAPSAPLTVTGSIASTSGGFVFPDNSLQATAVQRKSKTATVDPGGFVELVHGFNTVDVLAQGWVLGDKGVWRVLPAGTGCSACGSGKDGTYDPLQSTTLAGGTYEFSSLRIRPGVTVKVTGNAPLVIRVSGTATIEGILDASGGNGANAGCVGAWSECPPSNGYGVGGVAVGGGGVGGTSGMDYCLGACNPSTPPTTACTCGGPGGGTGGGARGEFCGRGSGGGGGGHATQGAAGSANSENTVQGGAAGKSYPSIDGGNLIGGSGGGSGAAGSGANAAGAGGGGGGGVIQITATTLVITGTVRANGGNGGNQVVGPCGQEGDGGGGGGGAGGAIWLRGNAVDLTGGTVTALGGTGGSGGTSAPTGGNGGNGGNGRVRIDSANAKGASNPAFTSGDASGTGGVAFGLQVEAIDANTVRLYNTSAVKADLRLTVLK